MVHKSIEEIFENFSNINSDLSNENSDLSNENLDEFIIFEGCFFKISIIRNGNKELLHHRTKEGLLQLYKERMEVKD